MAVRMRRRGRNGDLKQTGREMIPKDAEYAARVASIFNGVPWVEHAGLLLVSCEPGVVVTEMPISTRHAQQDGYVHAGALATLADHTAGGAAYSLIGADEIVLSVEFKVHMLRAATGERLRCEARVIKPGSRFHVVAADTYAIAGGRERHVHTFLGTMAVLPRG